MVKLGSKVEDGTGVVEVDELEGARVVVKVEGAEGTLVTVPADEMLLVRVYVEAAPGSAAATSDRTDFTFWVTDLNSQERASKATIFNGRADQ